MLHLLLEPSTSGSGARRPVILLLPLLLPLLLIASPSWDAATIEGLIFHIAQSSPARLS